MSIQCTDDVLKWKYINPSFIFYYLLFFDVYNDEKKMWKESDFKSIVCSLTWLP
jgi:hypothetical protein